MPDTSTSIVIGVMAGLITSSVGLIVRAIWIKIIKPFWENSIYKDAIVEGRWKGSFNHCDSIPEKPMVEEFTLELFRVGHAITGTMLGTKGKNEGRSYSLSGSFRNLSLVCIFEANDKKSLERGTLALMLKNNGMELDGILSVYADLHHSMGASNFSVQRVCNS